ncbi:MAG: hypothetical protein HY917_03530 [Candidatus Diapherotrites archaeon]|nr:hypothetical protein [Candidatus Diapherotrites archaeon]
MKWVGIGLIGILLILSGCTQIQGGNSTGEAVALPSSGKIVQATILDQLKGLQCNSISALNGETAQQRCTATGMGTAMLEGYRFDEYFYASTNGTCTGGIVSIGNLIDSIRTPRTYPLRQTSSCFRAGDSGTIQGIISSVYDTRFIEEYSVLCCK